MFLIIRRKRVRKSWIIIFFAVTSAVYFFWFLTSDTKVEENDWIKLKLQKDQSEYVDSKGVHVVIGHYIGEDYSNQNSSSLTDDILNSNMFDPKPNEGKNGHAVILPSFLSFHARRLFHINRFNLMVSDRIPLNRSLPDVRKKSCLGNTYNKSRNETVSVIIVFHNEAWSTLLRTVTSVINRSPAMLLKEIILVDDASTRTFLKSPLDKYVSQLLINTYVIHAPERTGLIRSRLLGAKQAKGSIMVFLDAHCECTEGWLESLVEHISPNRTKVACPVIDIINDDTFAYVRSFERHWGAFNWDLHFRWYTVGGMKNERLLAEKQGDYTKPFRTPVMAGGLFAINREYFFEIGAYDDQMEIWGGENLELSFRVWQCGGSIDIVPCSHVGHLFRKSSPYQFPRGVSQILYSNLVRVALVWMDEWGEFYFKYHPDAEKLRNQQVRSRVELRQKLNCRNFKWYLENIWSDHFMPMDGRFFGKIKHIYTETCLEKPTENVIRNQPTGLASVTDCSAKENLLQMFVMIYDSNNTNVGSIATDESVCLDVSSHIEDEVQPKVHVKACSGSMRQKWMYDSKRLLLKHISTNLCAEVPVDERIVVLSVCSSTAIQKWKFESSSWK